MKTILLIHQRTIPHYRVSVYNYLYDYLLKKDFILKVISGGIQQPNPYEVKFPYIKVKLNLFNLTKITRKERPNALILFVDLKNLYLFPLLLFVKMHGIKAIYWGHARDQQDKKNSIKNIAYNMEHWLTDAILLYSDCLKQYVKPKFYYKTFVANNTLNTIAYDHIRNNKKGTISKYNIRTSKNIICLGRMQKRRRIEDLVQAFKKLNRDDVGLVLAGPDIDNILDNVEGKNIYKVGPVYGEEAIKLLSSCDIYCLPGAVGLSIVDAFYCGLPFITEKVDHGPEISYLKDGINGFMVRQGDVEGLVEKLRLLLENDKLRARFSQSAKDEILSNGHINNLCNGFANALQFAVKN